MNKIIRWIAVLPLATAFSFLLTYVIGLLVGLSNAYWGLKENLPSLFVICVVCPIIGGRAFIYCGAWIAPERKAHAVRVLAGIGLLYCAYLMLPIGSTNLRDGIAVLAYASALIYYGFYERKEWAIGPRDLLFSA